jgi:hydroxyacylglutathione hydrolase
MLKYEIIPVTHYQQNSSLLWCETTGEAVVVDPGGESQKILARVNQLQLRLVKILLTHGHLDHVGGAASLAEEMNIPIIGPHKDDRFWLSMLPQQAQMLGFPPQKEFESTQYLEEGDEIVFGEQKLSVLHCPGHTPGHVIFYHKATEMAWVGDVIFSGSIGRTDFPRGNYDDLIHSIRDKLFALGDQVTFIPGHGPLSTLGEERLHNPFVADKRFG